MLSLYFISFYFFLFCRNYRRQVDILERQKSDLQNEVELLKQRYYSAVQSAPLSASALAAAPEPTISDTASLRSASTAMSSRVRFDIDGRVVSTLTQADTPPAAEPTNNTGADNTSDNATTWPPTTANRANVGIVYPSVLSSSATDISDVLSALTGTNATARPARDRFSDMNDSLSSSASGGGSSASDSEISTERRLREMLASAINPNSSAVGSFGSAASNRRTSSTVNSVHTIGNR